MGNGNRTKENNKAENIKKYDIIKPSPVEILDPKDVGNISHKKKYIIERYSFSGPLPSPKILDGYEQIEKGTANRIITMAETQMKHRHGMENNFLKSNSRNSFLGILFAFLLGLSLVIGGVICIINDKEFSGSFLGGAGLVGVIIAFIQNTKMTATSEQSNKKNIANREDL